MVQVNLGVLIYVVIRYVQLRRTLNDQRRGAAKVGGNVERLFKYRKDKITEAKTM